MIMETDKIENHWSIHLEGGWVCQKKCKVCTLVKMLTAVPISDEELYSGTVSYIPSVYRNRNITLYN